MVDVIEILNLDDEISNISSNTDILKNERNINKSHYIVSDADAELLILIHFKQNVDLKAIKLYASIDNIHTDQANESAEDLSVPKQVYIYIPRNLNVNFDDMESIKYD